MPIPTESLQALDDALSRLAAESMLATAGRDDGMIPSYSLLGEIREHRPTLEVFPAPWQPRL